MAQNLLPGENLIMKVHQHWIFIAKSLALPIALLLLVAIARRPSSQVPRASKQPLSLIGFMGSGKSVIGALVANRASAPFYDLDFMIETEAGMTISEIFTIRGEPGFRTLESKLLPEALREGSVVALGGGTAMNDENWALIRERSRTVYLKVPFESIWERIGR